MQLEKTLLLLSAAASLAAAENDVEATDVPSVCLPACQFTIDLSARCDRQTSSDNEYTPCVCGAQDAKQRLTECASCVRDNGRSDPDDNDVADLMDDCGWDFNAANGPYPTSLSSTTTTVINPSSTNPVGPVTVTETPSATPKSGSTTTVTTTTTGTTPPAGTTTPPSSMADALDAKAVAGPLLAGLVAGVWLIL